MIRLLKLEWLKNFNYTPFKIFSILYFAILVLLLFIGLVNLNIGPLNINLKEQGMYNYPEIWNFITYFVGLLKIFLGCIIVFSICQEFSNRMFKQNTIDGLSRKEFILSKLLTISLFTLISTLIIFIIGLYLGNTYSTNKDSGEIFKEIYFVGNYFVKLFTFFCFFMFLSVLLRKSIFVFLAFFALWIAETIVGIIEFKMRVGGLSPQDVSTAVQEKKVFFSEFLPLNSMSKLIPAPFERTAMTKMMGMQYHFDYPTGSLIACILWCVIFIAGSYFILKKKDW